MYIVKKCEQFGLTKRQGAIVQITLCAIIFISTFLFSDLFVAVSFLIAILLPLYLLHVFLIKSIYEGFTTLNLS